MSWKSISTTEAQPRKQMPKPKSSALDPKYTVVEVVRSAGIWSWVLITATFTAALGCEIT